MIYGDKLIYKVVIWVFCGIILWKEKIALTSERYSTAMMIDSQCGIKKVDPLGLEIDMYLVAHENRSKDVDNWYVLGVHSCQTQMSPIKMQDNDTS